MKKTMEEKEYLIDDFTVIVSTYYLPKKVVSISFFDKDNDLVLQENLDKLEKLSSVMSKVLKTI